MDGLHMGRSSFSWVASVGSVGVNSMMKSAKICSLIAILGLYLTSNSISSTAHFIVFQRFLVCAIFASLDIQLGLRWYELGSKVGVFWM